MSIVVQSWTINNRKTYNTKIMGNQGFCEKNKQNEGSIKLLEKANNLSV